MQSHIDDLELVLDLVEKASGEVRASAKFASLLKMILALGSVLNRGTYLKIFVSRFVFDYPSYLSSAKGFRLDTLLRLGETKARARSKSNLADDQSRKQANYSLLHYLAYLILEQVAVFFFFYDK